MNSIIQQRKTCYICGSEGKLHCHHIFYGTANREKSDEDGMTIWLCPAHHNMSHVGIHFNPALDDHVKQEAEKIWLKTYASDCETKEEQINKFIKRYGRNYLEWDM